MGKITFNSKDITKPFAYNGKQVVSLTYNGKVLTLKAAVVFDHEFPNGFAYSGTWPADKQAILNAAKADTGSSLISFEGISGVTAMRTPNNNPGTYVRSMNDLVSLDMPNIEHITFTSATWWDIPKLKSLFVPKLKTVVGNPPAYPWIGRSPIETIDVSSLEVLDSVAAFTHSELTTINFPKLKRIPKQFVVSNTKVKEIIIPECTYIEGGAFDPSIKITKFYAPKLITYNRRAAFLENSPTTIVTLPSKFNTDDHKNHLFGQPWDQVTFVWV